MMLSSTRGGSGGGDGRLAAGRGFRSDVSSILGCLTMTLAPLLTYR